MDPRPRKIRVGRSARAAEPASSDTVAPVPPPPEPVAPAGETEAPAPANRVFKLEQQLAMLRCAQRLAYLMYTFSGIALNTGDDDEFADVYGALRSACDGVLGAVRPRIGEVYEELARVGTELVDFVREEVERDRP